MFDVRIVKFKRSVTDNLKDDTLQRVLYDEIGTLEDAEHYAIVLKAVSDMITDGYGVNVYQYQIAEKQLAQKDIGGLCTF